MNFTYCRNHRYTHITTSPSCDPTGLYWRGTNKELLLSIIDFHGNSLAQFLTQSCRFLPAVIALYPCSEIGIT